MNFPGDTILIPFWESTFKGGMGSAVGVGAGSCASPRPGMHLHQLSQTAPGWPSSACTHCRHGYLLVDQVWWRSGGLLLLQRWAQKGLTPSHTALCRTGLHGTAPPGGPPEEPAAAWTPSLNQKYSSLTEQAKCPLTQSLSQWSLQLELLECGNAAVSVWFILLSGAGTAPGTSPETFPQGFLFFHVGLDDPIDWFLVLELRLEGPGLKVTGFYPRQGTAAHMLFGMVVGKWQRSVEMVRRTFRALVWVAHAGASGFWPTCRFRLFFIIMVFGGNCLFIGWNIAPELDFGEAVCFFVAVTMQSIANFCEEVWVCKPRPVLVSTFEGFERENEFIICYRVSCFSKWYGLFPYIWDDTFSSGQRHWKQCHICYFGKF